MRGRLLAGMSGEFLDHKLKLMYVQMVQSKWVRGLLSLIFFLFTLNTNAAGADDGKVPVVEKVQLKADIADGKVRLTADVTVLTFNYPLKTMELQLKRFPTRGAFEPQCYGDIAGSILMGSARYKETGYYTYTNTWNIVSQSKIESATKTVYRFERLISDGDNQTQNSIYCRGLYAVQKIGMEDDNPAPRDIQVLLFRSESGEITDRKIYSRFLGKVPNLSECPIAELPEYFQYCYLSDFSSTQVTLNEDSFQQAKAAADKAAADKAAADKAAADKAVKKTTSIICIKGKLTKKVTGVNPKCPAGYKKK